MAISVVKGHKSHRLPPSSTTYIDQDDFSLTPINAISYQPENPPTARFTVHSTAENDTTFQLQIHGEILQSLQLLLFFIDGMLCENQKVLFTLNTYTYIHLEFKVLKSCINLLFSITTTDSSAIAPWQPLWSKIHTCLLN